MYLGPAFARGTLCLLKRKHCRTLKARFHTGDDPSASERAALRSTIAQESAAIAAGAADRLRSVEELIEAANA